LKPPRIVDQVPSSGDDHHRRGERAGGEPAEQPADGLPDHGQARGTIVWLRGAAEATETTGLFRHDRRPRPATYLIGAGADDDATRAELWNYVAALAWRPHARSA